MHKHLEINVMYIIDSVYMTSSPPYWDLAGPTPLSSKSFL